MSKDLETGNGIAVLVVDDEPFVRMDMAEILRRAGFHVEEASNADEALRKLNGGGYPIRVLVTDVQMPGTMNGYSLVKRVRDRFPQAAIVVISGVIRPVPGEMPPNATFLAKPVTPERLVRVINEALAKKKVSVVAPEVGSCANYSLRAGGRNVTIARGISSYLP